MTKLLIEFLKNHRTKDKPTHTIMPSGDLSIYPWGKFKISVDKQDTLAKLLSEVVFQSNLRPDDPRKNIAIVECIPESKIKPITLDFYFIYLLADVSTTQHT